VCRTRAVAGLMEAGTVGQTGKEASPPPERGSAVDACKPTKASKL
jgi:hypothetical protein